MDFDYLQTGKGGGGGGGGGGMVMSDRECRSNSWRMRDLSRKVGGEVQACGGG